MQLAARLLEGFLSSRVLVNQVEASNKSGHRAADAFSCPGCGRWTQSSYWPDTPGRCRKNLGRRVCLHRHCYKRPPLILVFANWKKSEEDFQFYEKRQKAKVAFSMFGSSCSRSRGTPSSKSSPAKLPPQELHLASQHQAAPAVNCVCELLCSISVHFVHPSARCVLRQLLFCFTPFHLWKVSRERSTFQ